MRTLAATALALLATVALTACGAPESRYEHDYQQHSAVSAHVLRALISHSDMREVENDPRFHEYLTQTTQDITWAIFEEDACTDPVYEGTSMLSQAVQAGCEAYNA